MKTLTYLFLMFAPVVCFSQQQSLGRWNTDKNDLPVFTYEAALPFKATTKNGDKAKLPDDPWFLLGNYKFTLFTHVSGAYQLITGERAWGRVNQSDVPNHGINSSNLSVLDKSGKVLKSTHWQV